MRPPKRDALDDQEEDDEVGGGDDDPEQVGSELRSGVLRRRQGDLPQDVAGEGEIRPMGSAIPGVRRRPAWMKIAEKADDDREDAEALCERPRG